MSPRSKTTFEQAFEEAYDLACKQVLEKGIELCAENAGASCSIVSDAACRVELSFLNKKVSIAFPDFTFTSGSVKPPGIWEKILILHYLYRSDGSPLKKAQINFKQLKSGASYFPSFENRCIKPFVKLCTDDTDGFLAKASLFGGIKADAGDFAVTFTPLPYVPVTFVYWKADDEFPATGSVLFDESIEHFLSAEDIVVICQQIVLGIKEVNS